MKTLVIAEHNSENLSAATLSVVDAAKKLGRDIDLLVANNSCSSVLDEAKSVEGVSTVLNFSHEKFTNEIAEDIAACVVSVKDDYDFFLTSSSTSGKNNLPRVAALLDIQQISEVTEVLDRKHSRSPYMLDLVLLLFNPHKKKMLSQLEQLRLRKQMRLVVLQM